MPVSRAVLATAHLIATAVLVALVLVQAVLAGRSQFLGTDIAVHGYLGNVSFTLGIIIAVLAGLARTSSALVAMSAALLAALFAQTGLGYVGRTSDEAAAWHIPLGVAILGLATAMLAVAVVLRATPSREGAARSSRSA